MSGNLVRQHPKQLRCVCCLLNEVCKINVISHFFFHFFLLTNGIIGKEPNHASVFSIHNMSLFAYVCIDMYLHVNRCPI